MARLKPFLIAPVILIIFMTGIFWIVADCFNCPPYCENYNEDWRAYSGTNEIMVLLNDTLTYAEEHQIINKFATSTSKDSLIRELIAANHLDRNGIEWLSLKFNESRVIKPLTVPDLWNATTRFAGIELFPNHALNFKPEYNLHFLDSVVLTDQSIAYQSARLWLFEGEKPKPVGRDMTAFDKMIGVFNLTGIDSTQFNSDINRLFKETIKLRPSLAAKDSRRHSLSRIEALYYNE